jgi:hypothetical protein
MNARLSLGVAVCLAVVATGFVGTDRALAQGKSAQVQFWMKNLKAQQVGLRRQACEQLGKFGPDAREAVPALLEIVKNEDEDEAVRAAARAAVEKITGEPVGKAKVDPRTVDPKAKVDPKATTKTDPPAKTEPGIAPATLKAPPNESAADRLTRLSTLVRSGSEGEKVAAMEELVKLAKKGELITPALRAVCEAALDRREPLRVAALLTLEAAAPDIYKAVRVLITDEQPSNHITASRTLAQMGTRAAPTAPVLLEHMRNPHPWRRGVLKGKPLVWHSRVAAQIIVSDMLALARSSADDPAVLRTIIGVADFERYTIRFPNELGRDQFDFDARSLGMEALGEIVEDSPGLRKQIIPVFLRGLGQIEREPQLCLDSIRGLMRCGRDAKEALPALTKLKFHRIGVIRDAVADAIEAIDPPKIAGADVGEGILLGNGTGWLLTVEGHIVTNHHVIEGRGRVMVRIPKQKALGSVEIPKASVSEGPIYDSCSTNFDER